MEDARDYKYGYHGSHIRELQKKLTEAGYKVSVDGIFGDETKLAIEELEADLLFSNDSYSFAVDRVTLSHLFLEKETEPPIPSIMYPKGKGMFARSGTHLTNLVPLEELKDWIKLHDIKWVAMNRIRQHENKKDRHNNVSGWEDWVEVLESSGCDLWVWGWPVPSKIEAFVELLEETREEWGATGIIADVEGDFTEKEEEAQDLANMLNSLGCPVGMTSFGYAKYHPRVPFSAFAKLDFGIPQIYEASRSFDYPENYPEKCIDSWKELGYNKVIPASSAYKDGSDMTELLSRTPVEDSIVWWDWHNANLRTNRWKAIKDYDINS